MHETLSDSVSLTVSCSPVSQSFASASTTLPTHTSTFTRPHPPPTHTSTFTRHHPPPTHTSTFTRPHPPPTSSGATTTAGDMRLRPKHRKVASAPPPPPPPRSYTAAVSSRETSQQTLPSVRTSAGTSGAKSSAAPHQFTTSATDSRGTRVGPGGIKVRKIGQVSAPVDPLRTRPSRATTTAKTSALSASTNRRTEKGTAQRKRAATAEKRESLPPHSRSWALRPAASSVMFASLSDVDFESSETVSVSSERPGLVSQGTRPRQQAGGTGGGTDLSQMLQDLEASSDEGARDEGKEAGPPAVKRLFPSAASSHKRPRLTGRSHDAHMTHSSVIVAIVDAQLCHSQILRTFLCLLLPGPSLTPTLKCRSDPHTRHTATLCVASLVC